ncbi:hypothetical protein, partial [Mesorhizobium jarvisii]|uniref:hypothetical protein n=1 Tax=Mesorhizobium jarvisii TaxID=1777867 RepID=UPI001F0A12F5
INETQDQSEKWPASNRNTGRNEIGMTGRLQIGIDGRLRRNTQKPEPPPHRPSLGSRSYGRGAAASADQARLNERLSSISAEQSISS